MRSLRKKFASTAVIAALITGLGVAGTAGAAAISALDDPPTASRIVMIDQTLDFAKEHPEAASPDGS